MYIIDKILNNNVVVSQNNAGEEIIIMGRGIAFNKKSGDYLTENQIEKIFLKSQNEKLSDVEKLFSDVDERIIEISKQIVFLAESELNYQYSDKIYITLLDHINYAVQRYQDNIVLSNPLVLEIKKFYPGEFSVAIQGVELIKRELNIDFKEDEAGFIALHLVSNNMGQENVTDTMQTTEIVRDILVIIRRYFGIHYNENSLSYTRMVTHIQYFVQRILKDKGYEDKDEFLYELIQSKYPKAFQCSLRVKDYLKKQHHLNVEDSELIYLVIHINRVLDEVEKLSEL